MPGGTKEIKDQLSGASGKNLVLSQAPCHAPDRITWRKIGPKKSEVNLADAPLR
jgi:hypothetical protein